MNKSKLLIIICTLISIIGISLIVVSYFQIGIKPENTTIVTTISDNTNINTIEEKDDITSTPSENSQTTSSTSKVDKNNKYIGYLEIPKINLKKGFVNPNSKYNNIEYNVAIISGSTFPDVENGNFILAAHSGYGYLAFFNNLSKLNIGDKAKITYKNQNYTYKIKKIYTHEKKGYVTIYRDVNQTTLTLITCTKNSKTLQTIYVAELIKK